MTEQELEGAPAASETPELVVPEVLEVEQEVQQPSVPEAGITEARLIEILVERDEKQARKDQSAKDRAISRNAKDIADILERFEASGGSAADFVAEADQQATLEATQVWQANIESRLSQLSAPTKAGWKDEWDVDSQKVLDAAEEEDGTVLTDEEYNAAFFGQKFASRGDAYVALNSAINAKRSGKPAPIPASAVSTEGGEVAHTPEPKAPQTYRQQFDAAKAAGDEATMQKLIDSKWDDIDQQQKLDAARQALVDAGVSAEQLTE